MLQSPVAAGQLVDAWIGNNGMSSRSEAVSGNWLGRIQTLASSPYYLFEEGRRRHAEEQARERAEFETRLAQAKW